MKEFPVVSFCVYIGHRWRYRKNKNPKVLSTGSPNLLRLTPDSHYAGSRSTDLIPVGGRHHATYQGEGRGTPNRYEVNEQAGFCGTWKDDV